MATKFTPTLADFPAWEKRTQHTPGPASAQLRGERNRRIISTFERDGIEYQLHATKGVRRARRTFLKAPNHDR